MAERVLVIGTSQEEVKHVWETREDLPLGKSGHTLSFPRDEVTPEYIEVLFKNWHEGNERKRLNEIFDYIVFVNCTIAQNLLAFLQEEGIESEVVQSPVPVQ